MNARLQRAFIVVLLATAVAVFICLPAMTGSNLWPNHNKLLFADLCE